MSSDNPAWLDSGSIFHGEYRVVGCLSRGGMGAIYEVVHLRTKRRRALKVMLPSVMTSDEMRARFTLEATVVAAVESPHIAEVLDAGVDESTGSPFIVLELLRGENLAEVLSHRKTISPEDVVTFLSHAAFALEKAHDAGIVHRDLKPENLFLTHLDDGTPCVKVLDFGIAKVMDEEKTQHTRGILGTPLYISPEQVHGKAKVSPQTDVYALAHIGYTLLTGEPFWRKEEREAESIMPLLVQVMTGKSEPASQRALQRTETELPDGFDDWFDRATALAPAHRHPGPLAMVGALAEALGVSFAPSEPSLGTSRTGTLTRPSLPPSAGANDEPPPFSSEIEPSPASGDEAPPPFSHERGPSREGAAPPPAEPGDATVVATEAELASAQSPRHPAAGSATDVAMSTYLDPPARRRVWPLAALAAVVAGGALYAVTRGPANDKGERSEPTSIAASTEGSAPARSAREPEPQPPAPSATSSAPSAPSASSASSASTPSASPVLIASATPFVTAPPTKTKPPVPPTSQPTSTAWSPPVLDR